MFIIRRCSNAFADIFANQEDKFSGMGDNEDMLRKKFLAVLFAAIFVLQTLCIGASAKTYTIDDLTKMSLYDFYCTFAQAIVDHDYKTVGLFIPNSNDSQFKYSGVTFTGYKVELLKKARGEYEEDGKAAKITFNISNSNNKLFPVGKQEYYVYIDFYGVVGEYNFYPYSQKEKNVSDKYVDLYYASVYAAAFQFNFEDVSEKQLKNIEFTYFLYIAFIMPICSRILSIGTVSERLSLYVS